MKYAIVIIAAAAVIVVFSCSNERGGFLSNLLRGGPQGVPVTVETVASEEKVEEITVPATVEISETVDVTVPDDALIESFAVAEGEAVDAGDVIARISEDEVNLRVARLRADLREVQQKLEKDSYVLRNRDRLLDEGRIDEEQYDEVEDEVAEDEAEIERIQTDISRVESGLGELAVTTPIAGVVTKRYVSAGQTAQGGSPVATVSRIDPALVAFKLRPDLSSMVRPDSRIELTFPSLGGRRTTARVTSVATKIDPEDGMFAVRAEIANPAGTYKEGMRAEISMQNPEVRKVHLVPESAIIRAQRAYFVFTVVDGKAHRVQVIPEDTRGGYVEIARGLKDADMVVVQGQDKIEEGTRVDIWR